MLALAGVSLALLGACGCAGARRPDTADAVALVDGTPITKSTFGHWMTVATDASALPTQGKTRPVVPDPPAYTACVAHLKATAPKPAKARRKPTAASLRAQCEAQYAALKQEVLGFLISAEWVQAEASARGVTVSDEEVKKQFDQAESQRFSTPAAFREFSARSGESLADLLLRVKLNLLSQRIQKQVLAERSKVTQAQIAHYYDQNRSHYGTPETRAVRIILTRTSAQASAAKRQVESGESFAALARRLSRDPASRADGGLLKYVTKGEEQQALDTAIFSAQTHTLGGPVQTPRGYYLYEVLSSTPGTRQPLSQVSSQIAQQLASTSQQRALGEFDANFDKRWVAKTECRSGYLMADCRGFKAPERTSTGASAPATAPPGTTTSKGG